MVTSCIYHLKFGLFSSDFEWLGFQKVGTKFDLQKFQILNVSGFWKVKSPRYLVKSTISLMLNGGWLFHTKVEMAMVVTWMIASATEVRTEGRSEWKRSFCSVKANSKTRRQLSGPKLHNWKYNMITVTSQNGFLGGENKGDLLYISTSVFSAKKQEICSKFLQKTCFF